MNTNLKPALLFLVVLSLTPGCARQQSASDTDYTGSLTVDGLERTYVVHVPLSYHGAYPVPLVLGFHGGGGSAERMVELTGFNTLSDEKGFIVVYPNGVENHWNDGRLLQKYRAHRENIDDVAFVSALIDHLTEEYHIDELRIYAAGISNGAMMCCRLACELSERLAGIAMVAGAMPEELSRCSPSTPVSVVLINGTEDPLILWEGGEITIGRQRLGKTVSVSDTVQFWVTHNTCSSPVGTWLPDIHDDNTTVYKEVYGDGRGGTEVILYAVEGGGHTWPGGPQYMTELIVSRTCYDINATEVIWQFFAEHTRE